MSDWIHKLLIVLLVVLPLAGTLGAIVSLWQRYVFAEDLIVMGAMYFFTTIGVTIGYHRMLTHQGFIAHPVVKAFFLISGAMAFEGAPLSWAATHIKHHATSDTEHDPHSPLGGFWHAHMGWLFKADNFADPQRYARHLLKDPVVVFVDRFTPLWMTLALVIPFLVGGFTGLLWGGAVRIFLTTHITWSVNSVCHSFGRRMFEISDQSRNHWIIGLLGFGEGWHNNHHAFPSSAFHGLRWWQFDMSGLIIRSLEKLGLVWRVRRVSPEVLADRRQQAVDFAEELREQVVRAVNDAKNDFSDRLRRLSSRQHAVARSRYEKVLGRLQHLHRIVTRSPRLRSERLHAYLAEVRELRSRFRIRKTYSHSLL